MGICREALVEAVAETSEEFMDRYFGGEEFSDDEIRAALRANAVSYTHLDVYKRQGYNGLLVLPEDAKAGDDVKPILGLDDWIFDIAITANRPDCQCI